MRLSNIVLLFMGVIAVGAIVLEAIAITAYGLQKKKECPKMNIYEDRKHSVMEALPEDEAPGEVADGND